MPAAAIRGTITGMTEPVRRVVQSDMREALLRRAAEIPPLSFDDAVVPVNPYDDEQLESLDLAERNALRRVAGLSTELEDITEVE